MCKPEICAENFNPTLLYAYINMVNSESHVTLHTHDYTEVKIVLSGYFKYIIDDKLYEVAKGNIIIINPGVQHEKIIPSGVKVEEFNYGLTNIHFKELPENFLIEPSSLPVFTLPLYQPEIIKCINETINEQEKNEPYCDLFIKSSIMKLTALLHRGMTANKERTEKTRLDIQTSEKTNIVNDILEYLSTNYMEQISLYRIAHNMYLSPVYISKIFKEETGESPINHLIRIRLTKARELLMSGNMPIKTVARSVGYEDAFYFSKLYKKYYGIPPSMEKRSNAADII
ncbi:AraC family transcriptional regulator [Ruminiclostridium cellulolyticum]|uniref:Transcriptional regulator, AraC family n=1 Tax=Ruminiclostridium cellulolyticum (strain ATCC 35319 / DSM 5812 / JCM 6584 / H10) TaxID=394503 RepID=B8I1I4_RUMCH|nr:AraC family transcriptional regulator [Ruminiclostridium cellulolyticum]ACL75782.1 transcriptional regulator, AraC family [Ruminiclostridium cellulolyticum H10]